MKSISENKQKEIHTAFEPIAIIGMGCRFPGSANDPYSFWENIKNGMDCITETPKERWDTSRLYSSQKKHKGKVISKWGGYMDGIAEFDPSFFGITPREAEVMDPQQRKLLEVAWEAMEDAGQKPSELAGKPVGVFMGGFTSDYKILQFTNPEFDNLNAHSATGIMMTMLSNRLSYIFDFKGPSMSIDTACSSSLVAIHLACKSLQQGESSMALAGGVLITLAPQYTISESKGGFLSPTGSSHAYDDSANGYVRAEGAGIVVLKKLSEAIADGDPIHAVIKGTGVNQDGRTNGITVPNGDAQYELMKEVYAKAGIAPNTVQYVETHGTGTPVGDPIEANSVGRLLSEGRKSEDKCYIGSVKTNIGHTESAAGVAGLIKVVMAIKHKQIPPHLHLKNINPAIDIENHAYEIPTSLIDWPNTKGPATAGVNSFGFGGTNSHLIVQEYIPTTLEKKDADVNTTKLPELKLFPVTAKAEDALKDAVSGYADFIKAAVNTVSLNDIAYSSSRKRDFHTHRAAFTYKHTEELLEKLTLFNTGDQDISFSKGKVVQEHQKKLVWVFTGMGPQWWGMGRQLYTTEPVFKAVIDTCDKEMAKHVKWSLIKELLADEANSNMAETWISQPANFAIQVALAALWRSYGFTPDAIVGHSTGEAAAFYEAGVYSFEDAVKITVNRSRLQHLLHGAGKMLAVSLSATAVKPFIQQYEKEVSIAAINSPSGVTLAGEEDALNKIAEALTKENIFNKFLQVAVPYHSVVMDRIKTELIEVLADIKAQPAKVPLYATVTGKLAIGTELDNHYWWRNVRDTVLFADAIQSIINDGYSLFLELGPHPVLGGSITEILEANQKTGTILTSIRRKEDEQMQFMQSLAQLFTLGFEIKWERFYPQGTFVRLPKYPWRKDKYWTEPLFFNRLRTGLDEHTLLGNRRLPADTTWHSSVSLDKHPYLGDHRIQGNGVFPAAGYVEMAYAALHAKWGKGCYVIENLSIDKAVFLTESDTPNMKFILDEQATKFRIVSFDGQNADEATVHTTGLFRRIQQNSLGCPIALSDLQATIGQTYNASQFYTILNEFGYNYGPAFQGIKALWADEQQVLAHIGAPQQIADQLQDYYLHPSLLDACFQTLIFTELNAAETSDDATIRLPVKIERIRIDVAQLTEFWCHTVITAKNDEKTTGTIYLYNNEGDAVGIIEGFIAQSIDTVANNIKTSTIDGWLYQTEIQPVAATEQQNVLFEGTKGYWVLFADEQGVAELIANKLKQAGQHYCLVKPAEYFEMDRKASSATISPTSKEEISQLFSTLNQLTGLPCNGIIHLWNMDAPATNQLKGATLQKAKRTGVHAVFQLAKVIQEEELKAKLFLVTKNAQPYGSTTQLNILASSVWGLGRVLAQKELTENWGRLIDLDLTDADTSAQQVFDELQYADKEQEVIYRNNKRNVTRLVPTANLAPAFPTRLRADGTYLITGAFGAIGRLVAHYLIQHGATKLILVSRSPLPERTTWGGLTHTDEAFDRVQFVKQLEAKGAAIILSDMDVTREQEVKDFLDNYKSQQQPPIRGVFFCAGLVKDTLLSKMDIGSFDYVYSTKVTGSYILHTLLDNKELDHFVLFSSVAAQITTAGQTNYAAGNAFLDALAHYRRANGLPGLSINWGPWAIGMIKENNLIEHYKYQRGMNCILPEMGMQIMNRVLGLNDPQFIVCDADWPVVLNWYESKPLLFAHLSTDNQTVEPNKAGSFEEVYRQINENERLAFIHDKFLELVSNVLRCKKSAIDLDSSLISIGLDSIMATELRNKVFGYFNEAFPFVKLLGKSTIRELTEELNNKLTTKISFDETQLPLVETETMEALLLADEVGTAPSQKKKVVDEFPLSYGQQAIWFIHAMQPDSPAYNIGGAMHIPSVINVEALRKAIREVIQRHAALRTNFFIKDGKPYQRVYDSPEEDITVIDVTGQDEVTIRQRIITDNNKPYDLENDALYRIRLYQQAKDSNYFAVSIYHIISDAWSNYMFIDEMQAIYAKYAHNATVKLPELNAGYKDFVLWEQQNITGDKGQQMLRFWKENLPTEIPVLQLPFDRPRPKAQRNAGDSFTFEIDGKLTERLKALSRSEGVTMYITLLGIYHILMHKYSGQEEVIVGSPVSGRTNHQFDQVYGYFVNPLPIWASFKEDNNFSGFIQNLRMRVLSAIENQEYPFALLVNQLGLDHDASHSAVFQVLFVLLNHRVEQSHMDANNVAHYKGFPMHLMQIPEEEGQFDLTLTVYEENNAYKATLKYNTDLFNRETVEQFAMHYLALARQIVNNPTAAISEHLLVTPKERARILGSWKGQTKPLNKEITIAEKIRDISLQLPENIACKMADDKSNVTAITYAVLNKKSNQLANYLIQLGLKGNAPIGICMHKSVDLIIAITAVLKAGGYFIPIDPGQPEARAHKIINDTATAIIIRDEACIHTAPIGVQQITLNKTEKLIIDSCSDKEPAVLPNLNDIAYALYTSGSTGEPKGVMVTHANWMSIFESWYEHYELSKTAVHLQLANFNFDVFCGDFIRALACGKCLLLSTRETTMNIPLLLDIIRLEKVDIAEFVPSLIRPLTAYCAQTGLKPDNMKVLIVGSDYWTIGEYKRLKEICGLNTRVISSYGTTETTIDSSYFEGETSQYSNDHVVPIGKPFSNTELFILDKYKKPVPAGVLGELYIGGYGVSKGYLKAAELTASKFLTLTLDNAKPTLVYKTGDMARWCKSGNVVMVARTDNQLKVRGQRVEAGEIESAARSLTAVNAAIAVVQSGAVNQERLLCLYYTTTNSTISEREILLHLEHKLPKYMVPDHVMELNEWPLNTNGKIDKKKLPPPAVVRTTIIGNEPETFYEKRIAEIWKSILHVNTINTSDDFFSLGGNSLHLIELLLRIQTEFNVKLAINQLYLNPVLKTIATVVDNIVTGKEEGALPYQVYNPEGAVKLFCFPPAGGFSMVYKSLAEVLPDVQLISFNYLTEHNNLEAYIEAIKSIQPEGPYALFGYSLGGNLAFEVCNELEKQADTVSKVVIMDSYRITDTVKMREQDYKHFEEELREHFKKHVGSDRVASHVMEQAKHFITFSYQRKNINTINAELHFIMEENEADPNRLLREQSWEGSSLQSVKRYTGKGKHADMLDKPTGRVAHNAGIINGILEKTTVEEIAF